MAAMSRRRSSNAPTAVAWRKPRSTTNGCDSRAHWPQCLRPYCTARIDSVTNPSGHADQDVYLKALLAAGSVDLIEYGTYVARVKTAPLAVKDPQGRPRLVGPVWPVMVQDGHGGPVAGAVFMVSYANREEKGSDVNVAAHLLLDVLGGAVDGAVVTFAGAARCQSATVSGPLQ
jgi:hypothetical protein